MDGGQLDSIDPSTCLEFLLEGDRGEGREANRPVYFDVSNHVSTRLSGKIGRRKKLITKSGSIFGILLASTFYEMTKANYKRRRESCYSWSTCGIIQNYSKNSSISLFTSVSSESIHPLGIVSRRQRRRQRRKFVTIVIPKVGINIVPIPWWRNQ